MVALQYICQLFSQGDNLSQILSTSGNMKTRLLAAFVSFFIKLCGSDLRKGLGERRTFFFHFSVPPLPRGFNPRTYKRWGGRELDATPLRFFRVFFPRG